MATKRRRRRGEGSIFWSPTERVWYVRVSLGVVDGKRVRRRVRAHSEREARAELERLLRAYGVGTDPAEGTLDEYLAGWLRDHGPAVRPSTRTSYEGHIRLHISPLLGGIPVARLRPADVRRLIADRLAAGLSPTTVRLIVTTLHMALEQAVRDRSLPHNPAAGVDLPRTPERPVEAMSEVEALAIVDACRGTPLEALVELLLGSGMRVGEALGLDQGDLHLDDRFVLVRRTKTRVRSVPISDDAVEALRRHLATHPRRGRGEPVFLGPRKLERMRVDTATHLLPRILERAGLPPVTPHALRHGVATMLVAKGVPMRFVADQLGHANPALTARVYAHVHRDALQESVRLLNRRRVPG